LQARLRGQIVRLGLPNRSGGSTHWAKVKLAVKREIEEDWGR